MFQGHHKYQITHIACEKKRRESMHIAVLLGINEKKN